MKREKNKIIFEDSIVEVGAIVDALRDWLWDYPEDTDAPVVRELHELLNDMCAHW